MLVLLTLFVSVECATACGDKFLLVGRGARYQRGYVSVHPGSVLLYANTALTSARGLRAALKLAGHQVTVANNRSELDAALRTGKYDVLLADTTESAALTRDVENLAAKPVVVPVLAERTPRVRASSGREFCILNTENRQRHALAVLDDILGAKLKGTPSQCEPSK